ncbi:hypothetical protein H8955_18645, partial [Bacillus pumilus]|nr:hypothetical protein [Bacillus pumilus]
PPPPPLSNHPPPTHTTTTDISSAASDVYKRQELDTVFDYVKNELQKRA